MKEKAASEETRLFATQSTFRAWLAKNHDRSAGLWLELAKKNSGIVSLTYAEALDVALCYGWIDGQKGAIDAATWKQRFTPRSSRSIWSKVNREHVARLVASGDMTPHGLGAVERAKANGAWDRAYDSPKTATVPDDLSEALAKNAAAAKCFAATTAANRYAVLWRIQNAKLPATRARKVKELVAMLTRGEVLHPPKPKSATPKAATPPKASAGRPRGTRGRAAAPDR